MFTVYSPVVLVLPQVDCVSACGCELQSSEARFLTNHLTETGKRALRKSKVCPEKLVFSYLKCSNWHELLPLRRRENCERKGKRAFTADEDCAIQSKATRLKSETLRLEFILSSLFTKVKNEHS